MGVLSQGAMPKAADGRGPTNYDSLILQDLEVMGSIRAGSTVIGPEGITGLTGTFEDVNINNGTFSGIIVDDIVMTNAVFTGMITITGGSGLGNLDDADAGSIAETAALKWAGRSGADVKSDATMTSLTSGTTHNNAGDFVLWAGADLIFTFASPGATVGQIRNDSGNLLITHDYATGSLGVQSVNGDVNLQATNGNINVYDDVLPSGTVSLGAAGAGKQYYFGYIDNIVAATKIRGPHYSVDDTAGLASFSGAITNLTVKNGIVTAAS